MRSKHLVAAHSSLEIKNRRLENQAHGISAGCARSSILRVGMAEAAADLAAQGGGRSEWAMMTRS
jgi:hypothetical protein